MARSLFFLLASAVTVAGLIAVVWAACRIPRLPRLRTKLLAGILLVAYIAVIVIRRSSWPVSDLAVLLGATGGAVLIGTSLRSSQSVVAFLVTAAVIDILSLSSGLSRTIVDRWQAGTSDLLLYLTLVVPIKGRLVPMVGVGDLLVGGAAAMALIRTGFKPIAVNGALAIGLIAALAYGLWRGGAPGLPFMAVTISLLVWRISPDPARHANGASTR